jgi:hypothetical protein
MISMHPNEAFSTIAIQKHPSVAVAEQTAAMKSLMNGDASFSALIQAVEQLSKSAPADHDVLISAFNISVVKVRYVQPHTFIFEGFDDESHLQSQLIMV